MERGYLRRYSEVWELLFRVFDIAIFVACACTVHWYRNPGTALPGDDLLFVLGVCLVTIIVFNWFVVYQGARLTQVHLVVH
jgi:hypothetical protein